VLIVASKPFYFNRVRRSSFGRRRSPSALDAAQLSAADFGM
jgi:hypothetical protein